MAKAIEPFVGIGDDTVINVDHIVWFRLEKGGTLTVRLSVPGPDGEDIMQLDRKSVAAKMLLGYITDQRRLD